MSHRVTPAGKTATLLFFALTACYLALAPGSTQGRGYIGEEMESGNQMLTNLNSLFKGRPIPKMVWSRHGSLSVLVDLPFLKIGKFLVSQDYLLSLQPIVLTAGMMVLVFLWLRKVSTPWMSLLLTLTGAFATMLWPYAYIGLETKQSFFILLVGFLALANGKIRSWRGLVLFGIAGGLSLTIKGTGIVMWPAIAWLVYVQFHDDWRVRRLQVSIVSIVIAGVWFIGNITRNFYWIPIGGGFSNMRGWLTDSPILFITNFIGVFGSPVKGLAVFAPVLILAVYAIPRAIRSGHRDTAVFAILVTACTAAFISLLIVTSDEVWGPRYMHVAIAPLLVCIGAAWPRMTWKIGLPLAVLAIAGLAFSFLGAFSYYGESSSAMREAGQNTMEWIDGDPVWTGPIFEARLVRAWLKPGKEAVPWVATHIWVWEPPKGMPAEWRTIDLRAYATPQSVLLRNWCMGLEGTDRTIFRISLYAAIVGPLLLLWAGVKTLMEPGRVLP
jgi:hypothetical protein